MILLIGNSSILRVDFVLKRHMGYYILQVYVPSSMLVILSWVSFYIHREATADRVNIGAMTFLSLTTLSFDIRNYTAAVPYLTALDWFVIMAYTFLLASLLEFAFVHYFTKVCFSSRIWYSIFTFFKYSLVMVNHWCVIKNRLKMIWLMKVELLIFLDHQYSMLNWKVLIPNHFNHVLEMSFDIFVDYGFVYPEIRNINVWYANVQVVLV